MLVGQSTLNNFLLLHNTYFYIPVYQRNYAWGKDNCKKLLEDIVNISRKNKKHFIGIITYIMQRERDKDSILTHKYVIIDGQQRITTIMLLLKAISNKTQNKHIKDNINRILGIEEENYTRLRLKPIKRDIDAFKSVLELEHLNTLSDIAKSKIKINYDFLDKKLDYYIKEGYSVEEIYNAFLSLYLVDIGLESSDDDPQVVFESINGTGVHLKGVDLIRNLLMMDKEPEIQDLLLTKYWLPIEEALEEKTLEDFIIDYLRIYYGNNVMKNDYYPLFKTHLIDKFDKDSKILMEELLKYAEIYKFFLNKNHNINFSNLSDREKGILRKNIDIIIDIKFGVSYTFLMQILNDLKQEKLDFVNVNGMIEVLISYYVRRAICSIGTEALNKVTYTFV